MRSRLALVFVLLALAGCQDRKPDAPGGSSAGTTATADAPEAKPVAGAIGGKPFTPDAVVLQGKSLTFRTGKGFDADEIKIDLPEGSRDKLEGREWTFGGKKFGDPYLFTRFKEGKGFTKNEMASPSDYTMTLRITKQTAKSLEGAIHLKANKPANTHLSGAFTATIQKTLEDALDPDDAPYVQGTIVFVGPWTEEKLNVGFLGKGADGKDYSNMVGTRVTPAGGGGNGTSLTFDPQLTSIINRPKDAPAFRHTKLTPGEYVVYVRRNDVLAAWKKVTVKAEDQLTVDLTIDPAQTGEVAVTLPDEEANDSSEWHLSLIPAELNQPNLGYHFAFNAAEVKKGQKSVMVKGVPAGKYKAIRGKSEAEVEVVAGKSTPVTLVRTEAKKK
jgi:hypothetical protein